MDEAGDLGEDFARVSQGRHELRPHPSGAMSHRHCVHVIAPRNRLLERARDPLESLRAWEVSKVSISLEALMQDAASNGCGLAAGGGQKDTQSLESIVFGNCLRAYTEVEKDHESDTTASQPWSKHLA